MGRWLIPVRFTPELSRRSEDREARPNRVRPLSTLCKVCTARRPCSTAHRATAREVISPMPLGADHSQPVPVRQHAAGAPHRGRAEASDGHVHTLQSVPITVSHPRAVVARPRPSCASTRARERSLSTRVRAPNARGQQAAARLRRHGSRIMSTLQVHTLQSVHMRGPMDLEGASLQEGQLNRRVILRFR